MWSSAFWKDTAERVVSAFVLSLLGVFGTAEGLDLHTVKWGQILTAAGGIAALTLLKCLAAGTGVVGEKGSPSLVAPVADPDPAADERIVQRSHVEVKKGGHPGGNVGLVSPPTTRATGVARLGGDTAPPD